MSDLTRAIIYATTMHAGQLDKAGQPYILHPLTVMLSMPKDDWDGRIVAVLHDVLEDCPLASEADLRVWLPAHIVDAVVAISKAPGESNRDYWFRCKANPLAARVKVADMKHNASAERLSALPYGDQEYLAGKYAEAREYFGQTP